MGLTGLFLTTKATKISIYGVKNVIILQGTRNVLLASFNDAMKYIEETEYF